MRIVECVPNISEGRDRAVIDAVAAEAERVAGVRLLDVDPGADTNRTVITFVGEPGPVAEAAFRLVAKAIALIDMSGHKGAHSRNGAADVVPFVPVSGVSMAECVELARRVGRRIGEELEVPVYLYEQAATRPERQNLANVRSGEYEALERKLGQSEWAPDFGPARFVPSAGAIQVGARDFLVAYNINLNTRDVAKARRVAAQIREKGRARRGADGRLIRDEHGSLVREPGLFKECKATGWYLAELGLSQVTMNLTNYRVTPPHTVFDKVCELAAAEGVRVTGSEIVGLVPAAILLGAGRHYLGREGRCAGVDDGELTRVAIRGMGLEDLGPFDPEQRVVERVIAEPGRLVSLRADELAREVGSNSPAPGGGSVAALAGGLGAGLASMVANLTHGKRGYERVWDRMEAGAVESHELRRSLVGLVDHDTEAFDRVMAAIRLPRKTEEQAATRREAMGLANRGAAEVPLEVMTAAHRVAELALEMVEHGSAASLSDAGVASLMARAAIDGAYYNVLINAPSVGETDPEGARDLVGRARSLRSSALEAIREAERQVIGRLERDLAGVVE